MKARALAGRNRAEAFIALRPRLAGLRAPLTTGKRRNGLVYAAKSYAKSDPYAPFASLKNSP